MATTVEVVTKTLRSLETKKAELEKKQVATRAQIAELKNKRSELLLASADGDEAARAKKKQLDREHADLVDADATFGGALAEISAAIETKRRELRLAERQAVIAQLEAQIKGLDALDVKIGAAVRALKEATAGLFSAVDAVAGELGKLDARRFDGNYSYKLRAGIRDEILRSVQDFDRAVTIEPGTLVAPVKMRLKGACAQLSFEALEGRIPLAPNERLYRANGHIGIRGVALPPGSVIGLTDDEVAEFHRVNGKGWLIEEPTEEPLTA